MQKLYLIRGLPGSGKSTLAKSSNARHVETDMYFERKGKYCFQPTLLPQAHKWCRQQVEKHLKNGFDVVVSNTFVQQWEMKPYKVLAQKYNAELIIKVCRKNFGNIHDVPEDTLDKMKRNWEN